MDIGSKRIKGGSGEWAKQSKIDGPNTKAGRFLTKHNSPGPGEYFFMGSMGGSRDKVGTSVQVFSSLARDHESAGGQAGRACNATNTSVGPGSYSVAASMKALGTRPKSALFQASSGREFGYNGQGNVRGTLGETSESVGPGKYNQDVASQFSTQNGRGLAWSTISRFKGDYMKELWQPTNREQLGSNCDNFVKENIERAVASSSVQKSCQRKAWAEKKQLRAENVKQRLSEIIIQREKAILRNVNRQEVYAYLAFTLSFHVKLYAPLFYCAFCSRSRSLLQRGGRQSSSPS